MVSVADYYCFWGNMHTHVLKLWQDKEIWQDMEGLVINYVDIPVHTQYKELLYYK